MMGNAFFKRQKHGKTLKKVSSPSTSVAVSEGNTPDQLSVSENPFASLVTMPKFSEPFDVSGRSSAVDKAEKVSCDEEDGSSCDDQEEGVACDNQGGEPSYDEETGGSSDSQGEEGSCDSQREELFSDEEDRGSCDSHGDVDAREDQEEEVSCDDSSSSNASWNTTLGTRSKFSESAPTGETSDEESSDSSGDGSTSTNSTESSSSSSTTDSLSTSYDFSSLQDLSELSAHSTVPLRQKDIDCMTAVASFHSSKSVFRRRPLKLEWKLRPRFVPLKHNWALRYRAWAVRQPPMPCKGSGHKGGESKA